MYVIDCNAIGCMDYVCNSRWKQKIGQRISSDDPHGNRNAPLEDDRFLLVLLSFDTTGEVNIQRNISDD